MSASPSLKRTTPQKLAIFRHCFSGLTRVYGTYDLKTGRARQEKQPVTDEVILAHLRGKRPYGVYLLTNDRTRAVVADFDEENTDPPLQFVKCAAARGIHAYIERSKRKGYHVWIFADTAGASAAKARAVVRRILNNIGRAGTEVFPKQDRLEPGQYGNFINAPLFGPLVPQGRSVFLDPDNALLPYPDQWALLANVERISDDGLDRCLPQLSPPASALESDGTRGASARSACAEVRSATPCGYALPPCARRMLAGVTGYQRVSCFRLAIHLKRVGLPMDLVVALLKAWAAKNQPPHGLVITEQEIVDQTRWAYERNYRSYGCDDPAIRAHCDPSCPVHGGPVASVAGCVGRQNGRDRIGQEQKSS